MPGVYAFSLFNTDSRSLGYSLSMELLLVMCSPVLLQHCYKCLKSQALIASQSNSASVLEQTLATLCMGVCTAAA